MRNSLRFAPLGAMALALLSSGCKEQLIFTVEPVSVTSDQLLPEVRVALADANNKPLQTAVRNVTLSLGENPGGAELLGQTSVGVVNGVATFTSLRVTKVGTGYTLVASADKASSGTSAAFDVAVGTGQRLTFTGQPSNGPINTPFTVRVTVFDPDDNGPSTTSTAPVSLVLNDSLGLSYLSGTLTVNAVDGVATFDDLTIDRAGNNFTLTAYSPGLEGGTSSAFSIAEGPVGFPELVTVASNGTDVADRRTWQVCINSNGSVVGFHSWARNLDAIAETTDDNDVFVRNRTNGTTSRVTVAAAGGEATGQTPIDGARCGLSADGTKITFASDSDVLVAADPNPGRVDSFVRDLSTGTTTVVSQADAALPPGFINDVNSSAISPDGTLVAFTAAYPGFFTPADPNNRRDVIYRTWQGGLGATQRASKNVSGVIANADSFTPMFSNDGVVFVSNSNNLVSGDTNNQTDVFVHVRATGAIERVNLNHQGVEASGGDAQNPVISADSNTVAYDSSSPNVVGNDSNSARDVFARDRLTSRTLCVSCAADGTIGNRDSYNPSISGTGRWVVFTSDATNLVKGDFNGARDTFIKDLNTGVIVRLNVARDGAQMVGHNARTAVISSDGTLVAIITTAPLASTTNYEDQVYLVRNPLYVP